MAKGFQEWPSDSAIYGRAYNLLEDKMAWNDAIAAAMATIATTRYYEGDGHNDAGYMLALAFKNVEALKRT